jgi:hypothetical protein
MKFLNRFVVNVINHVQENGMQTVIAILNIWQNRKYHIFY